MRRFAVPAVIAAVAVIVIVVLAVAIHDGGANNSIAYTVASGRYERAPSYDAALPPLTNATRPVSFRDLRGKLVLVNFFASWCEPCQAEAPVLERAEHMLAAHGGTVLGIVFQNDPGEARSFVRQYGLSYPTVTDPAGHVADTFDGITGVPDSYLINRQGKIVWLDIQPLTAQFSQGTLPGLIAKWA